MTTMHRPYAWLRRDDHTINRSSRSACVNSKFVLPLMFSASTRIAMFGFEVSCSRRSVILDVGIWRDDVMMVSSVAARFGLAWRFLREQREERDG